MPRGLDRRPAHRLGLLDAFRCAKVRSCSSARRRVSRSRDSQRLGGRVTWSAGRGDIARERRTGEVGREDSSDMWTREERTGRVCSSREARTGKKRRRLGGRRLSFCCWSSERTLGGGHSLSLYREGGGDREAFEEDGVSRPTEEGGLE